MRPRYYRLSKAGEPVHCTREEWAVMFEDAAKRVVKQDWLENVHISTVFLGLDHSHGGPIPILWETMTFSNDTRLGGQQWRCGGSREQAEAMHKKAVTEVTAEIKARLKRR